MKFIKIGSVTGAFGLDGVVKIRPLTETPELFYDMDYLLLGEQGKNNPSKSLKILSIEPHGDVFLVECERVDSKVKAESLKNMSVLITEDKLPVARDDEVYWFMIQGAAVVDEQGGIIGTLTDYLETGGADIFCIKLANGKEAYISNNKAHVISIDVTGKKVIVDPQGLVCEG